MNLFWIDKDTHPHTFLLFKKNQVQCWLNFCLLGKKLNLIVWYTHHFPFSAVIKWKIWCHFIQSRYKINMITRRCCTRIWWRKEQIIRKLVHDQTFPAINILDKIVPHYNSFEELQHIINDPGIINISFSSNRTTTTETGTGDKWYYYGDHGELWYKGKCWKKVVTYPYSTSYAIWEKTLGKK